MMGSNMTSDDDFVGLPGPEWPCTSIKKFEFLAEIFST